ncbi:MAG: GTP 3',8-cyclase MoaA [Eubacteriales bacterium]
MKDRFNREIEYLRISIIDRCNLKCIYCAPEDCEDQMEAYNDLTAKEIESIVRSMAKVGIKKVRITGGEPLLRKDVHEIIERIAHIPEIQDISMTTNGINLDVMVEKLKKAGLKRLNISLDSLKEDKFHYITGGGKLEKTLIGIEKALDVGLTPVKINMVVIKGVNDDEIDDFIALSKDKPLEVRFIELMPIGAYGEHNLDKIIYNDSIIQSHKELTYLKEQKKGQPAMYYHIDGYAGDIGFISPMTHQFCTTCNRIRLTSDGKIKPCLGNNGEVDIISILRNNPENLDKLIYKTIFGKPPGHHFGKDFSSSRNMNRIGG